MKNQLLADNLAELSTPLVADAALRLKVPFRCQLHFAGYLTKRSVDSSYTFRQHLRKMDGAIEE